MKVRRLFVSPELITSMLTTGYVFGGEIKVTEGLPEGAVLVAIGWSVEKRSWALDFSHPHFDWVAEGQAPPQLDVTLAKKSALLTDALTE
jgi:hypothetical protein